MKLADSEGDHQVEPLQLITNNYEGHKDQGPSRAPGSHSTIGQAEKRNTSYTVHFGILWVLVRATKKTLLLLSTRWFVAPIMASETFRRVCASNSQLKNLQV